MALKQPKKEHFFNRDFSFPGGGIPGLEVKIYTPPLKILKRHPWLENGPMLACDKDSHTSDESTSP